uniref:FIP-RBD domain-containing protein n=1 Tax=Amphiprion ocellaris TaxID=80972 RepID=A0AAQ5Z413_AMPOC
MDEQCRPEPLHLLIFVKKLREVFDACYKESDGFIRHEHLLHLGSQFGQEEQVKMLAKCLDPDSHGRISFKDFCCGVLTMKGNHENKYGSFGTLFSVYAENDDVLWLSFILVTDLVTLSLFCLPPQHTKWRLQLLFVDLNIHVKPGLHFRCKKLFQLYFAVFGDIPMRVSVCVYSAGQTPRKVRHHFTGELMDVYCSQCSKKVNLLNDLEARLKNLKANSRQLLHNSNLSSSNGSTEDLFRDSIDSCDIDINEKVSSLEKKVAELENEILINGDLKSKLKQENTQLVHRVNELEELLKDQETRAEQNLQMELRRHREAYSKMERDKNTQIELLTNRVKQLEEENSDMTFNMCRLKSQTEKLDEEKQRMTDKLEDTSLRLKDEMDLYRKMMDKLRQNRQQFQKEKEAMQELIEDLRRELEHLQLYKLEAERPGRSRSSSSGLADFNSRTREVELEHEVKRLKQENQKLREQNDELNGQILSLSLYEAKNLFATQTKAQSLAAEIDNASRDQLMEALKEQEEINLRLRQYMDKIILSILDHNPSILEIKN